MIVVPVAKRIGNDKISEKAVSEFITKGSRAALPIALIIQKVKVTPPFLVHR